LIFAVGCTSPSNKIADAGLDRGLVKIDDVVDDLATQARYYIGEYYGERVNKIIAAGNATPEAINVELSSLATSVMEIDWLAMETYCKAREYTRFGQRYIWEQRGILDLLLEDYKTARSRALGDEENENNE